MNPLDPIAVDLGKTTLIEASAGTGKTYTIATLVLRLVAQGFPIESILVVTFTEAAAAELKLRIRTRLRETLKLLDQESEKDQDPLIAAFSADQDKKDIKRRLALALSGFDQAAVMTIHSFCLKILREYSFESRSFFDIELVPDRSAFLSRAGYDYFMMSVNDRDPLFLEYLALHSVTPESFVTAFKRVLSRPDMVCLPEATKYTEFYDDYRQAVARVRKIFDREADAVISLIGRCKGLDKRSYSKKNVPAWIKATRDKLATREDPLFAMDEKGDTLYKFTRTRMEGKLKEGQDLPQHPFFDVCQDLFELCSGFENNRLHIKHGFIQFLKQELEKVKQTRGICFFDDLINDLAQVLESKQGHVLKQSVRKNFKACLIDEFQDTDPRQYDIFSTLFADSKVPFFMIGDPKQAIYAFRGGDIFAYLTAVQQCDQQFTLDKNWRSAPLLVNGVNQIFISQRNPFVFDQIKFFQVGVPDRSQNRLQLEGKAIAPLQFGFIQRDGTALDRGGFIKKQDAKKIIPQLLAADILELIQSDLALQNRTGDLKPVRPDDIAVLVRTNEQAQQVQKALSALNIPSYQSATGSVFESDQAVALKDILQAVFEPGDISFIRAALSTQVFGFTAEDIAFLDQDDKAQGDWSDFFLSLKQIWDNQGFVSMIMALFHSDGAFLKGNAKLDERALTNFYHLVELISQAGLRFKFSAFHLMQWFLAQLDETRRDLFADELRLESDKEAVAIVTIHKSKGLEYPVVYLPFLWEGARPAPASDIIYHDPENQDYLTLDIGSDRIGNARMLFEKEQKAEQMRLLYVALTRAADLCRVFWGGFASIESSSLAGLLHPSGCKKDNTMLADLVRLSEQAPKSIELYQVLKGSDKKVEEDLESRFKALKAKKIRATITQAWRMSSFSAMTRSQEGGGFHLHQEKEEGETPVIALNDFPRGANSGEFFHSVFENIDFTGPKQDIKAEVEIQFTRFGFVRETDRKEAFKNILDVIATPLDNKASFLCLNEIKRDQRLNEMGFTLPIEGLTLKNMVHALSGSNIAVVDTGYSDRLMLLEPSHLDGFLKGFIDLIFRYNGRFYIADYKSNFLGSHYESYAEDRLPEVMADHHYFLQYHIYLLALHRYLSVKMADYDYDTHIGGVYYLFIRGMLPEYKSKYGVFFDRPPKPVVEALSDCL